MEMGTDAIYQDERQEPWRSLQRRVAPMLGESLENALERRLKQTLEALERYLIASIHNEERAAKFLNLLPTVRMRCNEDIYDLPMAAEAYAYTHLANRYVRWWKVLHSLFESGWLPMRRVGIDAMDIGSGPAPATYALIDFMASISDAVATIPCDKKAQQLRTDAPRITLSEKSREMARLVHHLSEHRPLHGPYGVELPDFFELRLARTRASNAELREILIQGIMNAWEDVGYDEARAILMNDDPNWHQPKRFHLSMVSYLLTTETASGLARPAFKDLRRTLPPGGTIVIMGGMDDNYARIHARVKQQMSGLHHLQVTKPFTVSFDDPLQVLLKPFYARIAQHARSLTSDIEDVDAPWRTDTYLRNLWDPDRKVPSATFAVEIFRAPDDRGARQHRRARRH